MSEVTRATSVAPALLGVVGQDRRVDVGEGPHAQAVERVLAAHGQPHDGAAHGEGADHDDDGADDGEALHDADVDAVGRSLVDGCCTRMGTASRPPAPDHGAGRHGEGGPPWRRPRAAPPTTARRRRARAHSVDAGGCRRPSAPGPARTPRRGGGSRGCGRTAPRGGHGRRPGRRRGRRPRRPARWSRAGWPRRRS